MNLKEMVENAPEGTTHFYYTDVQPLGYLMVKGNHCKFWNSLDVWSVPISNAEDIFIHSKPRLLSDVKRIVALEESLNDLLNDCINFGGDNLTKTILEEASELLQK